MIDNPFVEFYNTGQYFLINSKNSKDLSLKFLKLINKLILNFFAPKRGQPLVCLVLNNWKISEINSTDTFLH